MSKQAWKPVLAAAMSLTVLAACSPAAAPEGNGAASPQGGATSPGTAAAGPKKEISISVFDRGEVPAEEGSYENNRWTKWVNENSPATVKWVPIPRNQAQQKISTLVASGSAPDLIWEYDRNYIAQLANQGAIQPIDSYIEKYSTTLKKYMAEHPELKAATTIDGKLYAVTSSRSLDGIANHAMWIRQDWLDKLGLKAPTTIEELIEVAKKFKDSDPDGNGKADTVPIVFNGNGIGILRALFSVHENQWFLEDGKLKYGRTLDRFKDSIAFQKSLFDQGLIDKEYITDTNFQRSRQLLTTGKAGIYLAAWNIENEYKDLKKNVPDAKLNPLEPVASQYGRNGLYQELPANILVTFNSQMKEDKIEAAVKFLDWMMETGDMKMKYGEENVHYKLVNGEIPQYIDADKYRKEVFYAREFAVVSDFGVKPEWFPTMAASDAISQEYAKLKTESLNVALKNKYRRDIAYSPDLPEVSQLIATFQPIATQIEVKAVTGGSANTPEAAMEEVRKEWKRLGGENVEKLAQEWYEKNKETMTVK
ncbi:putative aldouronate transport system substrate-binding protein [Paenibacillus sp. UNCCL117]|uniref:extracellular solute-binding protein n=1 Tax=unclassified Paenibacillus TaxID=185978 RepID=UPI00087E901A|nr:MULTISPECIES: extracellular solute-binding protein [unclassified Paenibacillus]SDD50279.1 putative aldouronate transport system substrate-binding protein [Paenibacillus sp. cl123]SFW49757.1 putative aldouronate transport system substrate-binding protein [Paenibacillus sp. UNCCL117]